MLTVWGRATSVNLQAVVWALAELNIPFERIDAGGSFGGLDTPEFGQMNPNRLVPVLSDGDLTMWESAAIVRYLGARYGDGHFWPSDPAARARIDKWAEWTKTTFGPTFLTGVFWPLIGTPAEKRDTNLVANSVAKLSGLVRMIDARLGQSRYLGGETLAFGDVIFGAQLFRYFTLDFDKAEAPNLAAYYERLTARPAYAKHVTVSYDSLRAR
jgi:glutathione S-transferase